MKKPLRTRVAVYPGSTTQVAWLEGDNKVRAEAVPLMMVPKVFEEHLGVKDDHCWRGIECVISYPAARTHGAIQVRYAANLIAGWLRNTYKRKTEVYRVSPDSWLAGMHYLVPDGYKTEPPAERCAWVARERLHVDDPAVAEAACMIVVRYLDPGALNRGSHWLTPRPSDQLLEEVRSGMGCME